MNLIERFNPATHKFFMLDIETTGKEPCTNRITSICILRFSPTNPDLLEEKLHIQIVEDWAFSFATTRDNDLGTMKWRDENKVEEFEESIEVSMRWDSAAKSIVSFLGSSTHKPILFTNHPEFDIAFLNSYWCMLPTDAAYVKPWLYNKVYDLGSILLAEGYTSKGEVLNEVTQHSSWKKILNRHFNGEPQPHNAFYDCMLQAQMLVWNDL